MMVSMEEALQRIQEWRDDSRSMRGKGVGVGEVSLVLAAVLSTIDFDSLKRKSHTPLHALAGMDYSDRKEKGAQMRGIVKLLKSCGLDIDTRRGRGGEEMAMRRYEDEDDHPVEGETPLITAALNEHFSLVKELVKEGADVNKGDWHCVVPLAAAASWGWYTQGCSPIMVSYLLRHGARVENSYALHNAARCGCPESVGILLKAGAEPTELDRDANSSPAVYCCGYGDGDRSTRERLEALSLLLGAGADLNQKGFNGMSLLHEAARAGHGELIEDLVHRGLAVDVKDSEQGTALHCASDCGEPACVKTLIRLGASLDARDSKKGTPLHTALQSKQEDCAAELIDAGANVNAKRDGDIAPLHIAVAWGSMRLVYLLLEAGADVDALADGGSSPLMVCMSPEKSRGVELTLPSHEDPYGSEMYEGRKKVAALLLEVGAAVTKPVMALAGESDCGDVIGAYVSQGRCALNASDGVCNTIAGHISGSAYSEAAKEGRVVRVCLVDRKTGKSKAAQYTLSIPLMELLMDKTGQSGRRGEGGGSDRHDNAAAGSLPTMLDPAVRGFMGIRGEANGKGKSKHEGKVTNEVEVTFDGVDFSEEGFAAVVQFVTTGSVKSLLTRGPHGLLSTESMKGISGGSSRSSEAVDGGGDVRGGGSSREQVGKSKRERVKLFDDVRAKQALQAAAFFCIEAMSREVKALMTLYGFELGKEAEEDEPRRKRSRENTERTSCVQPPLPF